MPKKSTQSADTQRAPEWASGYSVWLPERLSPILRAGYTLVDLARRGLLKAEDIIKFRNETLLADFAWRMVWADPDNHADAESIAHKLREAEGIVIFIHGWAGSGEIWEDLPALVVKANPNLMALVPDVNGFGGSPFSSNVPPIDKCDPPAIMRAIEAWINLIHIRPAGREAATRPIIFVGHSMGGASLFFADDKLWKSGEIGRIALAPALLMNDRQRQLFYRTVGTGIRLSGWNDLLDWFVETFIAPRFIERAAGAGSSLRVRAQHHKVFDVTPEGVIAQTFAAMGHLDASFARSTWPNFIAYLSDKDALVGLKQTEELLEQIHFKPEQIRVVEGGHYFFSVGGVESHAHNRQKVIDDILSLQATMRATLNKKSRQKPASKKSARRKSKKAA